jgi:hypothetical protein
VVKGFRLRVGWGAKDDREDPSGMGLGSSIIKPGATRNVYIGGIKDFDLFTEDKLRSDFEVYGEVEMINFLKDKAAAFVNLYVRLDSSCPGLTSVVHRYRRL